jgi:hypothetical protein
LGPNQGTVRRRVCPSSSPPAATPGRPAPVPRYGNAVLQAALRSVDEPLARAARDEHLQEERPVSQIPQSGGQALPPELQARYEGVLGVDLSAVRIHQGPAAAAAADALQAEAFALGADLFFAPGMLRPGSAEGERVLAHELVHVWQFLSGSLPAGGGVSEPGDAVEREAYAAEMEVARAARAFQPDLAPGLARMPAGAAPTAHRRARPRALRRTVEETLAATGDQLGDALMGDVSAALAGGRSAGATQVAAAGLESAAVAVADTLPAVPEVQAAAPFASDGLAAPVAAAPFASDGFAAPQIPAPQLAAPFASDGFAAPQLPAPQLAAPEVAPVGVPAEVAPAVEAPVPALVPPAPVAPETAPVPAPTLAPAPVTPPAPVHPRALRSEAPVAPEPAPAAVAEPVTEPQTAPAPVETPSPQSPAPAPALTAPTPSETPTVTPPSPPVAVTETPTVTPPAVVPETAPAPTTTVRETAPAEVPVEVPVEAPVEVEGAATGDPERAAALREQIASLDVQIADLHRWIEDKKEEIAALDERIDRLEHRDQHLSGERAELDADLAELQEDQAALQEDQAADGAALDRVGEAQQRNRRDRERIERGRTGLSLDRTEEQTDRTRLEEDLAALEEDLSEAEADRSAAQQELDGLAGGGGGGGADPAAAADAALQQGAADAQRSVADAYPEVSGAARGLMSEVEAQLELALTQLRADALAARTELQDRLTAELASLEEVAAASREQVRAEVAARRTELEGGQEAAAEQAEGEADTTSQTASTTTLEQQMARLEEARTAAAAARAVASTEADQILATATSEAEAVRSEAQTTASGLESQASSAEGRTATLEAQGAAEGIDAAAVQAARSQAASLRAQAAEARRIGEARAQERLARGEADAAARRARGEEEAEALLAAAGTASETLQISLDQTLTDLEGQADVAIAAAGTDAEAALAALAGWEAEALGAVELQLATARDALERATAAALAGVDTALAEQEASLRAQLQSFAAGVASADGASPEALLALRDQQLAALDALTAEAQAHIDQVAASGDLLAAEAVAAGLSSGPPAADARAPVSSPSSPLFEQVLQMDAVDLVLSGVSLRDAAALTGGEHEVTGWADVEALAQSGQLAPETVEQLYAAGAERLLASQQAGEGPLALYVATYDETTDDPEALGLAAEQAAISEGLGESARLVSLTNPTPAELQAILAAGDFSSAFVGGHAAEDGGLALPGPGGERVVVPPDQLASILGAEETLTGVFLNVCGSEGAGDELLAQALTARGLASLSWTGAAASAEQAVPMAEVVARAFAATGDLEVAFGVARDWYEQVLRPAIGDTTGGDLRLAEDESAQDTAAWDPYRAGLLQAVSGATEIGGLDTLDGDEVARGGGVRDLFDYELTGASTLPEYTNRAALPTLAQPEYASAYSYTDPLYSNPLTPFTSMTMALSPEHGPYIEDPVHLELPGWGSQYFLSPFTYDEQVTGGAPTDTFGALPQHREAMWGVRQDVLDAYHPQLGATQGADGRWVVDEATRQAMGDMEVLTSIDAMRGQFGDEVLWLRYLQQDLARTGFGGGDRGAMWSTYGGYLATLPPQTAPQSFPEFWARTMTTVLDTPPEAFGTLTPAQQDIYVRGALAAYRTGSDGVVLTDAPGPAVYDTLELIGQVEDGDQRDALMLALFQAAGPEGLVELEAWATSRSPEMAEDMRASGGAAGWLADTYGPERVLHWARRMDDASVSAAWASALTPALAARAEAAPSLLPQVGASLELLQTSVRQGGDPAALASLLRWAAAHPENPVGTFAIGMTFELLSTPGVAKAVSGPLALILVRSRHPEWSEDEVQERAARLSGAIATDDVSALLQGAANPAQSAALLGLLLEGGWDAERVQQEGVEGVEGDPSELLVTTFQPLADAWAAAQTPDPASMGDGAEIPAGGERQTAISDYVLWASLGGVGNPALPGDLAGLDPAVRAQLEQSTSQVVRGIETVAGDRPVEVTAVPIQFTSEEGGGMFGLIGNHEEMSMTIPLYQVKDAQGNVLGYVDHQGNSYDSVDEWVDVNPLPDGMLTWPRLDDRGNAVTSGGQALLTHRRNEDNQTWVDDAGMLIGIVGGIVVIVGTGGTATPLVAAGYAAIGLSAGIAIENTLANGTDMVRRGQSIAPWESWSNAAMWADLLANTLGLGAAARGLGFLKLGTRAFAALDLLSDVFDYGAAGLGLVDLVTNPDATGADLADALLQTAFFTVVMPRVTDALGNSGARLLKDAHRADFDARMARGDITPLTLREAAVQAATDPSRLTDDQRAMLQIAVDHNLFDPAMFDLYQRYGGDLSRLAGAAPSDDPQLARDVRVYEQAQQRLAARTAAAPPAADVSTAATVEQLGQMWPGEAGVDRLLQLRGVTDLQSIRSDLPQFLNSLPPEQLPAWLDALEARGIDRQGLLRDALIVESGSGTDRAHAYQELVWGERAVGEGGALPADELARSFSGHLADPTAAVDVVAVLSALPPDGPYRDAFFAELYNQGTRPEDIVALMADGEGGLTPLEAQLVLDSIAGTSYEQRVTAELADLTLASGTWDAARLEQLVHTDASRLSPGDRALAMHLQSQGLVTPGSLRLFLARDPVTGAIDPSDPAVQEVLLDPLRQGAADLGLGVEGAGADLVALLYDARAAGGPALVDQVLAFALDGVTDGATPDLADLLYLLTPEQRAQVVAITQDTDAAELVQRRVALGEIALRDPSDPEAVAALWQTQGGVDDLAQFVQMLPEESRGPWLDALAADGTDTFLLTVAVGEQRSAEGASEAELLLLDELLYVEPAERLAWLERQGVTPEQLVGRIVGDGALGPLEVELLRRWTGDGEYGQQVQAEIARVQLLDQADQIAQSARTDPSSTAQLAATALATLPPDAAGPFLERLESQGLNASLLVETLVSGGQLDPEGAEALLRQVAGTPYEGAVQEAIGATLGRTAVEQMELRQLVELAGRPPEELTAEQRLALAYLDDPRLATSGGAGAAYLPTLPSGDFLARLDAAQTPAQLAALAHSPVTFALTLQRLDPESAAAYFASLPHTTGGPLPWVQELASMGLLTPDLARTLVSCTPTHPDAASIREIAYGAASRQIVEARGYSPQDLQALSQVPSHVLSPDERLVLEAMGPLLPTGAELDALSVAEPTERAALVAGDGQPNPVLFAAALDGMDPSQAAAFFDELAASGVSPASLTQHLSALGLLTPARAQAIASLSAGSSQGAELRLVVAAEAVGWDLRRIPPDVVSDYYESVVSGSNLDAVVDGMDPGASFARGPGSDLEPSYAQNAADATRFFLAWTQSGAPTDNASYLRMNAVMQAIMASGPGGDRSYGTRSYHTRDIPWGRYRVQLDPLNINGGVYQYMEALGVPGTDGRVGVEGVPEDFLAWRSQGLLFYPQAGAERYYADAAIPSLQELVAHPAPGSPEYEAALARYFHASVSAHYFDRVNLSLVQAQINGLRAVHGLDPIVIDNLDMVAQRLTADEFVGLFQMRAAGELPLEADVLALVGVSDPVALADQVQVAPMGATWLAQKAYQQVPEGRREEFLQLLLEGGFPADRLPEVEGLAPLGGQPVEDTGGPTPAGDGLMDTSALQGADTGTLLAAAPSDLASEEGVLFVDELMARLPADPQERAAYVQQLAAAGLGPDRLVDAWLARHDGVSLTDAEQLLAITAASGEDYEATALRLAEGQLAQADPAEIDRLAALAQTDPALLAPSERALLVAAHQGGQLLALPGGVDLSRPADPTAWLSERATLAGELFDAGHLDQALALTEGLLSGADGAQGSWHAWSTLLDAQDFASLGALRRLKVTEDAARVVFDPNGTLDDASWQTLFASRVQGLTWQDLSDPTLWVRGQAGATSVLSQVTGGAVVPAGTPGNSNDLDMTLRHRHLPPGVAPADVIRSFYAHNGWQALQGMDANLYWEPLFVDRPLMNPGQVAAGADPLVMSAADEWLFRSLDPEAVAGVELPPGVTVESPWGRQLVYRALGLEGTWSGTREQIASAQDAHAVSAILGDAGARTPAEIEALEAFLSSIYGPEAVSQGRLLQQQVEQRVAAHEVPGRSPEETRVMAYVEICDEMQQVQAQLDEALAAHDTAATARLLTELYALNSLSGRLSLESYTTEGALMHVVNGDVLARRGGQASYTTPGNLVSGMDLLQVARASAGDQLAFLMSYEAGEHGDMTQPGGLMASSKYFERLADITLAVDPLDPTAGRLAVASSELRRIQKQVPAEQQPAAMASLYADLSRLYGVPVTQGNLFQLMLGDARSAMGTVAREPHADALPAGPQGDASLGRVLPGETGVARMLAAGIDPVELLRDAEPRVVSAWVAALDAEGLDGWSALQAAATLEQSEQRPGVGEARAQYAEIIGGADGGPLADPAAVARVFVQNAGDNLDEDQIVGLLLALPPDPSWREAFFAGLDMPADVLLEAASGGKGLMSEVVEASFAGTRFETQAQQMLGASLLVNGEPSYESIQWLRLTRPDLLTAADRAVLATLEAAGVQDAHAFELFMTYGADVELAQHGAALRATDEFVPGSLAAIAFKMEQDLPLTRDELALWSTRTPQEEEQISRWSGEGAGESGLLYHVDLLADPDAFSLIRPGDDGWTAAVARVEGLAQTGPEGPVFDSMMARWPWLSVIETRPAAGRSEPGFRMLPAEALEGVDLTAAYPDGFQLSDLMWTTLPDPATGALLVSSYTGDPATDLDLYMAHELGHAADYGQMLQTSLGAMEGGAQIWQDLTSGGLTDPAQIELVVALVNTYNAGGADPRAARQDRELRAWAAVLEADGLPWGTWALMQDALGSYGTAPDRLESLQPHTPISPAPGGPPSPEGVRLPLSAPGPDADIGDPAVRTWFYETFQVPAELRGTPEVQAILERMWKERAVALPAPFDEEFLRALGPIDGPDGTKRPLNWFEQWVVGHCEPLSRQVRRAIGDDGQIVQVDDLLVMGDGQQIAVNGERVGENHHVYLDAQGRVWDPLGGVWGGMYIDPATGQTVEVDGLDGYLELLGLTDYYPQTPITPARRRPES